MPGTMPAQAILLFANLTIGVGREVIDLFAAAFFTNRIYEHWGGSRITNPGLDCIKVESKSNPECDPERFIIWSNVSKACSENPESKPGLAGRSA